MKTAAVRHPWAIRLPSLRSLLDRVETADTQRSDLEYLAAADGRILRDIGTTRAEVAAEIRQHKRLDDTLSMRSLRERAAAADAGYPDLDSRTRPAR